MDISKILEQLRKELGHLDAAILSLEKLQENGVRRGRPPKALSFLNQPLPTLRPGGMRRRVRGADPTD